jgi:lipopolysaccharide/colanic/teichoic acid biosynthesis glycosyltransferase
MSTAIRVKSALSLRKSPKSKQTQPTREWNWYSTIEPEKLLIRGQAYHAIKRAIDLTLTIVTMPFWLTIIVICAILIKLDSPEGPVFFTQMRPGQGGRRFKMYKLRTMVPNAEALNKQLIHMSDVKGIEFKMKDDPRITRVGKFLRKTSLDELPQLFNVLLGDMSIIGPRPTVSSSEAYELWQTQIFDVKPGITGLWQITGRGLSNFDDRVRLDVAYIKRYSFWMDMNILVRTIPSVLWQKGAH